MRNTTPRDGPARMLAASVIVLLTIAVAALSARSETPTASALSLRTEIDARYPGVPWVATTRLASWIERRSGAARPVLLDAREPGEYGVSHIAGARRVDPDNPDIAALSSIPNSATVVVYCSVGYRSAHVAARLRSAGYTDVYNLAGGIFQWANEARPIYSGQQEVELVHPYDSTWGRMLNARYRSPL